MKTTTAISVIVALVAVFGLGWYFYAMPQDALAPTTEVATTTPPTTEVATTTQTTTPGTSVGVDVGVTTLPMSATVSYSASGFSPSSITVAKGATVTFTSTDGSAMWVGADEHPSHTEYDGTSRQEHCATGANTSFDQCKTGASYTFTFNKNGSFDYHNHVGASKGGVVIVK